MRLSDIVDSSDCAIIGITTNGIITSWNRGAQKIYGYTESEVIGKPVTVLAPDEGKNQILQILDLIRNGRGTHDLETIQRKKNGEIIPVSLTVSPIFDQHNVVLGASVIACDISIRKSLEREKTRLQLEQFRHHNLASLGTFVSCIGHDFNNMFQAITVCIELLISAINEGRYRPELAENILRTVDIAAYLLQNFITIGQLSTMETTLINLNEEIRNEESSISNLRNIHGLSLDLAYQPAIVNQNPDELKKIIMILAKNASEAMPDGGHLRISTTLITLKDALPECQYGAKPGSYVLLTVTDTGTGIDETILPRIFDPYFSTKERCSIPGMGLSLSVLRGIIQQRGGFVTCESELGKGTTFRVYFPAVKKSLM